MTKKKKKLAQQFLDTKANGLTYYLISLKKKKALTHALTHHENHELG